MRRAGFANADLAAIAVGGVAGAALRWAIVNGPAIQFDGPAWLTGSDPWWDERFGGPNAGATVSTIAIETFSTAVLVANLIGCLILGLVTALIARSTGQRRFLLGLGAGFCGSLTTFSTFATDVADLLTETSGQFSRNVPLALTYVIASLVGGAAAFWAGRRASRLVPS